MASGVMVADGTVGPWLVVNENVHVSVNDTFGSGTVAVEKIIKGTAYPVYEDGTAVEYTAPADERVNVSSGDLVQLTLSGSTGANVVWSVTGFKG